MAEVSILHGARCHVTCGAPGYSITLNMAQLLLESGADANRIFELQKFEYEPQKLENLPLYLAIVLDGEGFTDCTKLLLSRGAKVNVFHPMSPHRSPLQHACFYHSPAVIPLLFQAGADPSATIDGCDNPLFVVLKWETAEEIQMAIRQLVEAGADINALNCEDGRTLLHSEVFPITRCRFTVVQALINNGASVKIRGGNGDTTIHILCRTYYHAQKSNDLQRFEESAEICRLLVEKGVDPKARNDNGYRANAQFDSHPQFSLYSWDWHVSLWPIPYE